MDRTLNWGDPADAGTRYRTRDDDPAGGGNFVVVEDLDGGLIPLQYNPTTGKVETAVPVDTGSNDITTTGAVSAATLEAGERSVGSVAAVMTMTTNQTGIPSESATTVSYDTVESSDADVADADATNSKITLKKNGFWLIKARTTWQSDVGWSSADQAEIQLDIDGERRVDPNGLKISTTSQGTEVSGLFDVTNQPVDVTADVFQNSGVDQSLIGAATETRLECVHIG